MTTLIRNFGRYDFKARVSSACIMKEEKCSLIKCLCSATTLSSRRNALERAKLSNQPSTDKDSPQLLPFSCIHYRSTHAETDGQYIVTIYVTSSPRQSRYQDFLVSFHLAQMLLETQEVHTAASVNMGLTMSEHCPLGLICRLLLT